MIITLKLAGDPDNKATAAQVASQAESVALAGNEAYARLENIATEVGSRISEAQELQGKIRVDLERKEHDGRLQIVEDALVAFTDSEKKKTAVVETEDEKRNRLQREAEEEADDERAYWFNRRNKLHEEETKRIAKDLKETNRLRVEQKQRANEAAVVAVQGLADIAEGSAKLGLVSEENVEKFLKQFIVVQEGIQVFKGITDVWWKGREALIALSSATKTQATYNELLAISNTRVAASQAVGIPLDAAGRAAGGAASSATGKAAGGVAGSAAAGAAGGAVASGGSALGGAVIAGKFLALAVGLAAAGAALHDLAKYTLSFFIDFGEDGGQARRAILGVRDAADQLTEGLKKTAKAQEERADKYKERDFYTSQSTARIGLQDQLRGSRNRVVEAQGIARGETGVQGAERVRVEAVKAVQAAELELFRQREYDQQRVDKGFFKASELKLKTLTDQEAAYKRLYDAEVNRLSAIRAQNEATSSQLSSERERLVALQEQQRIEEKGLNAKLGELNPGLQKQAVGVAEKVKAGKELTLRDINIMKEAGVGQDQITSFYEDKGKNVAGANAFTEVFGSRKTRNDIADAEEGVEINRRKLFEGKKLEETAGQSVTSTASNLDRVTEARIKFEAELKLAFNWQIEELENNVKLVQDASADAVDALRQQGMATVSGIKSMQDEMVHAHLEMQKMFERFQLQQKAYQ
ncbi:hypothetical protein [Gimesia sp.]|uniref:hypothetical protein n=1 Tax=Gimesia sp. TaxID=2024833 RepID=UPI003A922B98